MNWQIKIYKWSATDYSYLVNNELGWVSDNEKYYEFDNLENKSKMERYLRGDRMNKRIKELAEQAAEYCKTQPREIAGTMWEEKFAELIVKECAKVADNNFNKGFCPVGDYIKQHFDILETNNE